MLGSWIMKLENWITGIVITAVFILLVTFCGDTGVDGPPRFFGEIR